MMLLRALTLVVLCALPALANAQPASPLRVAVLYFDYEGSDEELKHLRKGLASMLISDLSDVAAIDLVERVELEKVLRELKLQKQRYFDKSTAAKIGRGLGANVLVTGRYFVFRGKLALNVKVIEVETGRVRGVRAARSEAAFFELEQEVATKLKRSLSSMARGKPAVPPGKVKRRKRPRKPKRLATRTAARYGKALDAIDRGDQKKARVLLKKVVSEQPDFALAQGDLLSLAR